MQDVDTNSQPSNQYRGGSHDVTVFTCTMCGRMFLSQSHARLHCVIHTNKKPFRCTSEAEVPTPEVKEDREASGEDDDDVKDAWDVESEPEEEKPEGWKKLFLLLLLLW